MTRDPHPGRSPELQALLDEADAIEQRRSAAPAMLAGDSARPLEVENPSNGSLAAAHGDPMVPAGDNPERVAAEPDQSAQHESEPPAATPVELAAAKPPPTAGELDNDVDRSPDEVVSTADEARSPAVEASSSADESFSSADESFSSADESFSSAESAGPVVRADEYPIRVARAAIPSADRSPTVGHAPAAFTPPVTSWRPARGVPSLFEPSRSPHRPPANEGVANPAVAAADPNGPGTRAAEYPVLVARAAIQSAEHEPGVVGIALANPPRRSRQGTFALAAGAAAAVVAIVAVGVSSRSVQSSVPGKSGNPVGAAIVASVGADGTTSRTTVTAQMTSVGGQLVALVTAADGSIRELPVLAVLSPTVSTSAGNGAGAAPGRLTPNGSTPGSPAVPAGSSTPTVPKVSSSTSAPEVVPRPTGAASATELQVLGTERSGQSSSPTVRSPGAAATGSAGTTDMPARTADQAGTTDQAGPATAENATTERAVATDDAAPSTTEEVLTTDDPAPTTSEEIVTTADPAPTTSEEIVTTADPAPTTSEEIVTTENPATATTDQTDTGQAPGDDSATVIPGTSALSGWIPVPTAGTGDRIGIGPGSTVRSSAGASASGSPGALTVLSSPAPAP